MVTIFLFINTPLNKSTCFQAFQWQVLSLHWVANVQLTRYFWSHTIICCECPWAGTANQSCHQSICFINGSNQWQWDWQLVL